MTVTRGILEKCPEIKFTFLLKDKIYSLFLPVHVMQLAHKHDLRFLVLNAIRVAVISFLSLSITLT